MLFCVNQKNIKKENNEKERLPKKTMPKKIPQLPFVSVCTPTFNRRPFMPYAAQCFLRQDYPMNRMEWVVVDDGTDPVEDVLASLNIPQLKYFRVKDKMTLGAKRNMMHEVSKGDIIVYMDDDDYYPVERVSHAVDRLMKSQALCAGSSAMFTFFKHTNQMVQFGPYNQNHATAGTFAFKRKLLQDTAYDPAASIAEEQHFLKNYTVPLVQLDPMKTILVFSHAHNTFDKRKLLETPSSYVKYVPAVTVQHFIQDASMREFYLNIDLTLQGYAPGAIEMKPDVVAEVKRLEEERKKKMFSVVVQTASGPRQLYGQEIVTHLNQLVDENKMLRRLVNVLRHPKTETSD